MKRSKFSDSQIVDAVKRVEAGLGVPDICRELGISTATFYKWRAKYGGMDVSMMSRMKELDYRCLLGYSYPFDCIQVCCLSTHSRIQSLGLAFRT